MSQGQQAAPLETPVLFLVFNRPETTARVFESIRKARPRRLFVAADGPRAHVVGEAELCARTRAAATAVDWDCEVKTLFRARNQGCRTAVSSGITWFFQNVEEGIILEDDTLPVPGFFSFCADLLEHYRDTPEVMHVSGDNFQLGARRGDGSYYFSLFNHIWGWATWRRAWSLYDVRMERFESFRRRGVLDRLFADPASRADWLKRFEMTARGEIDTWDYQWTMTIWNHGGMAVLPQVNLVSNIGFGPAATHTTAANRLALLPVGESEPLRHPSRLEVCREADEFSQRYVFGRRLEDPDLLALDVAGRIEADDPAGAAILARGFLTLHPGNMTLAWLEVLALVRAEQRLEALDRLVPFLAAWPEHDGARMLLESLRKLANRP